MRDYYQILGINATATSGQIKVAYRRLALKYHPDRNPDDEHAEDRFVELTEAYNVLSDPRRRSRYDQGISPDLDLEYATEPIRRKPPAYYYYKYKPEKVTYTRRDYTLATITVIAMIIVALVVPIYLLQITSDKYYNLAVSNYYAGNYYTALQNIDMSIKDFSSNNDEACALASVILVHRLQRYDFALRYINRGLEYDPEDSLASEFHYLRGICHMKLGDPNLALNEFALVKKYSPNYDSSLYKSATLFLFSLNQPDTADLLVDKLLSRNEENQRAAYLKGLIFEKKSDHEKAYQVFLSLTKNPFNEAAIYYHLARAEIKLSMTDSACAHLEIASRHNLLEAIQLKKLYCKDLPVPESEE